MRRFFVVMAVCVVGLAGVLTAAVLPAISVPAGLRGAEQARTVPMTEPGAFTSVPPTTVLDTRTGVGAPQVPVAPSGTLKFRVAGRGGVPASGVSAVVLNVAVTSPSDRGFVSVYGAGKTSSESSNLNFFKGQRVRNLVIAQVWSNGEVALHNASLGTIQLTADVSGYYRAGDPTAAGAFASLAPSRLLDTRAGLGGAKQAVEAGGTVHLQVTGRGGVPASGASAAVLNVTVTQPSSAGFVSVSGAGTTVPGTPNLNFVQGQTIPNLVVAAVGAKGVVDLYNGSSGTVHLVVDVLGYHLPEAPNVVGAFGSLASSTLLDTRIGVGAARANVAEGDTVHLQVTGRGGVPASGVSAVVLNVTATSPTRPGYVSVSGDGTTTTRMPSLTFPEAQTVSNLVIVPVGAKGRVALYNGSGASIRLAADVAGYYRSGDRAVTVSTGVTHSCAVTGAGGVRCWGLNAHGELGDGTTSDSSVPVDVAGMRTGVKSVSAGLGYTCAVMSSGGVKCWGHNAFGELGAGTTSDSAVPVDVVGLGSGATAVSAGWSHSCAVTSTGAVKCWGRNAFGELGNGTTSDSPIPVEVVGLHLGSSAVSAGEFHSCAVTSGRAVKCWGNNAEGELGNGTTKSSAVPVDVVGLGAGASAVSAGGYHSCAVTSHGAAKCWGHNPDGELGDGTASDSAVPVGVLGLGSAASAISAGRSHSCAVTSAGGVRCWGARGGALGHGTTAQSAVPVDVVGLGSGMVAVSSGGSQTCARASAGALTCWGTNGNGELGAGTAQDSSVPVDVVGLG